jgi:hypothetical protein
MLRVIKPEAGEERSSSTERVSILRTVARPFARGASQNLKTLKKIFKIFFKHSKKFPTHENFPAPNCIPESRRFSDVRQVIRPEQEKNISEFSDGKTPLSDVKQIDKTGLPFIFQHHGAVQKEIGPPIASISVF